MTPPCLPRASKTAVDLAGGDAASQHRSRALLEIVDALVPEHLDAP